MMLDNAATKLVNARQAQVSSQIPLPVGRMFSRLTRQDRVGKQPMKRLVEPFEVVFKEQTQLQEHR